MNKKFILTVLVILVIGVVAFVMVGRTGEENIENEPPIVSYDSAEYQKCVEDGGEVTDILAPSFCVIDGKKYSDGNF